MKKHHQVWQPNQFFDFLVLQIYLTGSNVVKRTQRLETPSFPVVFFEGVPYGHLDLGKSGMGRPAFFHRFCGKKNLEKKPWLWVNPLHYDGRVC